MSMPCESAFKPTPRCCSSSATCLRFFTDPAEPVKFRHDERVSLAQISEGFRERRPLRQGAGCVLDEYLVAARSIERIRLAVGILVSG